MPSVVLAGYLALIIGGVGGVSLAIFVYAWGLVFGKRFLKRHSALKMLPIALLSALIGGCIIVWAVGDILMSSYYPPEPKRKPATQDIVGTWQLTRGSVDYLREEGYPISTHTLGFEADGTFTMTNLPDLVWNFGLGTAGREFQSGVGTWTVEKDINGNWSTRIFFSELNGAPAKVSTYFNLYGKEPPYLIYEFIGDPDSGRILTYERR